MKKIFVSLLLVNAIAITAKAQYDNNNEEEKGKFKKENIFVGTSLNLGVSGNVFQLGANPEVGYSITKWLDAGIATNINYTSIRYNGYSDRYFVYGAGSFVRIWPVRFLFLTAQPEYNFIKITEKYTDGTPSIKLNQKAGSFLLGAGYGNRIVGQAYSYLAIMFDAANSQYSPYRDEYRRAIPIFRAGFALYLKGKNDKRY